MTLPGILVLACVVGGATRPDGVSLAWAAPGAVRPSRAELLVATANAGGTGSPACFADVCQPRVAVPGHEPRYDSRGRRTELALALLDRLDAEPLAGAARTVAATGLRLDWVPPQMDRAAPGHTGFGRVTVLVRWRLDAWSGPVWPARRAP